MIPYLNLTPVAGNADKAFSIVSSEFQITWVMILYFFGVMATAWHLAYGLFLFAVDWGLVIGEKAQKMTLTACMGIALMLSFVGINAAYSFVRPCGLLPQALCEAPKKTASAGPAKF